VYGKSAIKKIFYIRKFSFPLNYILQKVFFPQRANIEIIRYKIEKEEFKKWKENNL
jgi:hypothetical protein